MAHPVMLLQAAQLGNTQENARLGDLTSRRAGLQYRKFPVKLTLLEMGEAQSPEFMINPAFRVPPEKHNAIL
jgi:hypothetical protein